MDNPLGGIVRGWPEMRGVYERLFSGPARVRAEFFDYTLRVFETVFFAVGSERWKLQAGNATSSSSRYARAGFSALPAFGGVDCTTTVRSIGRLTRGLSGSGEKVIGTGNKGRNKERWPGCSCSPPAA
jgi:hypothetical protein